MVHVSLHWTNRGIDDLSLWTFDVRHDAWSHYRGPNQQYRLTPIEILTKIKADYWGFIWCHICGCPVYVLDPKLNNDQNILMCNHCARIGKLLDFFNDHSLLVANMRKFQNSYISPQYHAVFDHIFHTVFSSGKTGVFVAYIYNQLFEDNHNFYAEE